MVKANFREENKLVEIYRQRCGLWNADQWIKDLTIYSILELYRLKFKCLRFLSNILSTT
jgi:hypothetical protein